MDFKIHTKTIYYCSLERAFKAPILCYVTKVHTGFGLMPAVTKTTNDENCGEVGAIKNIYAAKSLTFKGGEVSTDEILERVENKYWKVEVGNFKSWMLNIWKFTFEWTTTEIEPNKIQINYDYTILRRERSTYSMRKMFYFSMKNILIVLLVFFIASCSSTKKIRT